MNPPRLNRQQLLEIKERAESLRYEADKLYWNDDPSQRETREWLICHHLELLAATVGLELRPRCEVINLSQRRVSMTLLPDGTAA